MDDSQKLITVNLQKKKKKMKNSKISLEEYLDFFSSNKQLVLTAGHLNQIIRMHGYIRIKDRKNVLTDAVSAIDLINLSRSTLEESVSSSASSILLEDVISDLKDLGWQECCVTSLLTFGLLKQNDYDPSPDHQEPTRASKKPGRKLLPLIECLGEISAVGVSSSSASKNPGMKFRPQSKRKKTAAVN